MGSLWLVATPIGNLDDLAPRAVEVLTSAQLVCCEDTRRTGLMLHRAGVRAQRLAVANDHTETARTRDVLDVLDSGGDVAVVSDAGSPGISDPGYRLVCAAIEAGHHVTAVPGPSAAITALTLSGLPTDRFRFEGFLPRGGKDRADRLEDISTSGCTVIIYESPHRVSDTLADLRNTCGDDRRVVVARELTKLHEEVVRATLATIDVGETRGEYVIVLDAAPPPSAHDNNRVRAALEEAFADGTSTRDAAAAVAAASGRRKREVYELAIELRSEGATHGARQSHEEGSTTR